MNCTHQRKHFCRFRYEVKGETRWHKTCQCLDCGQRVKSPTGGIWWPREFNENISKLPEFNLQLLDNCIKTEDKQRIIDNSERRKNDFLMRHKQYEIYLNSDAWAKRRTLIFARCNDVCECCLIKEATQVHHVNYKTIFDEVAWDLRGVCADCHKRLHGLILSER